MQPSLAVWVVAPGIQETTIPANSPHSALSPNGGQFRPAGKAWPMDGGKANAFVAFPAHASATDESEFRYMLTFNGAWRFTSPATIEHGAVSDCLQLISRIASQGDQQDVLEHFKIYFAKAAGSTASPSSSASWAESDLRSHMYGAAENAPLFIEALYDACQAVRTRFPGFAIPDDATINRILLSNGVGFQIQPPRLLVRSEQEPIPMPAQPTSLAEQAQELIQQSQAQSEQLLLEGRPRQAVQEILWLLETVVTAFRGLDAGAGTVQGK
jgi:hypothetical protein